MLTDYSRSSAAFGAVSSASPRITTSKTNSLQVCGRNDRETHFGSDPGVVTTMLYSAAGGAGAHPPKWRENDVAVVHM
jgi:hypothetical protein